MTPADPAWDLRSALQSERIRRVRKARRTSLVIVAGVAVGIVVALGLDAAGLRALAVVTLITLPLVTVLIARRSLHALVRPVEAALMIARWMGTESLIDADGRLTPAA